ncbi:zinc finger protein basonuclin-2-like isoform X3 [Zootermopsis nevadensis]|uniref:zinc finger protein basonuclin-2-like isoform X3 n=1 Tax=Zootermopsis nevadensis TaxID=136037 RepID=UPI000B8EA7F3|nr:zinc finger protein basonuclin-2-like isoform X3 [Zootermopsis nevadensis]
MIPSYSSMGVGDGRGSPPARGDKIKMPTAAAAPRMRRPDDQSAAKLKLPGNPANGAGLMMEVAIRCTVPSCSCECFTPGKMNIRYCDTCNHSWVPHALDKLGFRHLFGQSPVEPVQPNVAFDIASLVLYGCQALPIRLKILLDRLFSVLQREEVLQVLHGFGWTHEDYARGYILQEPHGSVLDRWNICSPEEEPLVLQQFLRFGETRAITQQLLLAQQDIKPPPSTSCSSSSDSRSLAPGSHLHQLRIDSDIKKFIERTSSRVAPSKHQDGDERDRDREREKDRDKERERSSKTLQHLALPSLQQHPHRTHKQRTLSPNRRPSPPTTVAHHHHTSHHPHPLHLGLHHPTSHPTHTTLPSSRPPPPPPMSPLQKQAPINLLKLPPGALPATNGPCKTSSPPSSISSSPLSVSPLNRLQSMQPFDFRKIGGFPGGISGVPRGGSGSPEIQHPQVRRRISETSDTSPPGLMNLSITSPSSLCLPPPPPPPPPIPASSAPPISFCHSAMAAAVASAGPLAAASLVASSLPGLISSVTTPGSKSPSAMVTDFMSGGGSSEFGSDEDDDDEENSHSALNLSRDGACIKPRQRHGHIRKATTPMKRQWGSGTELPLNLGTQLINPTTGKKRVQCNVCLKTFCDKGALKIHFSAVHLREMHKCTVEGCNMMFSSRRSRNRHSANPNPKLHSPHLRRKISPHDGRSAQSHPILIPPPSGLSLSAAAAAALNPLSFSPFPLLTPPPELRHQTAHSALSSLDPKQSLDLSMHRYDEHRKMDICNNTTSSDEAPMAMNLNNHHTDDDNDDAYDDDEDGIVVDGGADDDEPEGNEERGENGSPEKDDECGTLVKRVKLSESDLDEITSNLDSNEDSLSVVDTHSLKEENGTECAVFTSKNVRKRKNQNPTRCAIPSILGHNDLLSDEDSSSDVVFAAATPEENATDIQQCIPVEQQQHQSQQQQKSPQSQCLHQSDVDVAPVSSNTVTGDKEIVDVDMEEDVPDAEPAEGNNQMDEVRDEVNEKEKSEVKLEGQERIEETDRDDSSEIKTSLTPLIPADKLKKEKSQLERTEGEEDSAAASTTVGEDEQKATRAPSSAGSHNSDESLDSSHALRQLESLSHGHFGDLMRGGGLNLGQSASPLLHSQHQFPSLGFMMGTGPPSPEGSSITSNGPDSPSEDNSQNMFFHDSGGFIGNLDVPIDKDNPRRCTACGKIFQNHFGVKTHFQNVHLKLMHKCTVEGCNAAFPSKRSRDRHSANLNLHRKLLSTSSSDKSGGGLFLDKSPFSSLAGSPSLHSEFLARLYAESQTLPMSLEAFKNLPHSHPHLGPPPTPGSLAEQMLINGERIPPPHPSLLLPPLGSLASFPGLNNFTSHLSSPAAVLSASVNGTTSLSERKGRSSGSNSPSSPSSPPADRVVISPNSVPGSAQLSLVYSVEEDMPMPDHEGFLPCTFCRKSLADTAALKEHYEQLHLGEMYRCTVPGCDKVFSSRSKRNLHSDNEALHKATQQRTLANDNCS